jgi:protocatechuate 3,4-dioxygenase beta subunit
VTRTPGVLEANLERLFARAYVPVEPSPEFRARLLAELRNRRKTVQRTRFPVALRIAAAAAIAVAAGIALWRPVRPAAASVESILADGRAALREGPGSDWRPLTDEEARSGVRLAGAKLDLATPAGVSATVRIGSADRLETQPSSQVALADDASSLVVALDRGSLVLEHPDPGREARIASADGGVRLATGAIELACLELDGEHATRALLRSGAATADVEPSFALPVGSPVWLRDGAVVAERGLDGATAADSAALPGNGRTGAEAPGDASSAPVSTATTAETASLRGRVSGSSSDAPPDTMIGAYVVTLLRAERLPQVGRPDPHEFSEPSFALDGLEPGTYTVFVGAKGCATWQRSGIELAAGKAPVDLSIVLDRGATVRGRVLGPNGEPVEGATVLSETDTPSQLLPLTADPRVAITAVDAPSLADGTFELGPLSKGRQRLRATHPGFGAAWSEPFDLSGRSGGIPDEIVLHLARPGVIEGEVARDDGAPWPNAIVVASWLDMDPGALERQVLSYGLAFADATGHYAIEDLPPGLFVVLNVLEGTQGGENRVPRVQQARVEAGGRVRVDLPGGGVRGTSVEGTLLSSDGKPLADRDVTFEPEHDASGYGKSMDWKSTRSREDGRFDFPGLAPGSYRVFAGANLGGEIAFQTEVEVPKAPVFRPVVRAGPATMRGRITDADTGLGLSSSLLVLFTEIGGEERFAGRIVADAEGRYALALLQPGKYRITAYSVAGRYGQETLDAVEIGTQEGAACDFALRPGVAITVRVRDDDGRPIESASLRFADSAGRSIGFSPEDRTDPQGEYVVRGAKPGRWTLRVEHAGHEPADAAFELVVGEDRTLEVRLHPVR